MISTQLTSSQLAVRPLHPSERSLISSLILWVLDVDRKVTFRSVASSLCVGLAETINKVGPAFVEGRKSLSDV